MEASRKHTVIYDTDPGVDDAMALYFALAHPDIDLIGVTTTFGNVTVEQAAKNALYLCAIAGRSEIPVTQGVSQPRVKHAEAPPDFIHGADGLGNLPSRYATSSTLDPRTSAQLIVDTARKYPGEVSVVAVGPLGNLARALELEPELPTLLRKVVLMGGTVLEPGNVSPVAEANIWNDPHAADLVFGAGFQLTMVGLDVTHRVILPLALFERIAKHHKQPATDTLLHAVAFYSHFYSALHPQVAKVHGCFGHDVLAFLALTQPELFSCESGRVRVATEGLAQGQTILKRSPADYPQQGWGNDVPETTVCMQVEADACVRQIEAVLMSDWLKTH
jgi:inosine-uridine nucleoside N-ribohydrolase